MKPMMRLILPLLLGASLTPRATIMQTHEMMRAHERYARWMASMNRMRGTPLYAGSGAKPSRPAKANCRHRNKAARSRRRVARLRAA